MFKVDFTPLKTKIMPQNCTDVRPLILDEEIRAK